MESKPNDKKRFYVIVTVIIIVIAVISATGIFLILGNNQIGQDWTLGQTIKMESRDGAVPMKFIRDSNDNIHFICFEHGAYQGLRYLKIDPNGDILLDKKDIVDTNVFNYNYQFDIVVDSENMVHIITTGGGGNSIPLEYVKLDTNGAIIIQKTLSFNYANWSNSISMKICENDTINIAWAHSNENNHTSAFYYAKLDNNGSLIHSPIRISTDMNLFDENIYDAMAIDSSANTNIFWIANGIYWSKVNADGHLTVYNKEILAAPLASDVRAFIGSNDKCYLTYREVIADYTTIGIAIMDMNGIIQNNKKVVDYSSSSNSNIVLSSDSTLDNNDNIHLCWDNSRSIQYMKINNTGVPVINTTIITESSTIGSLIYVSGASILINKSGLPVVTCTRQSGLHHPFDTDLYILKAKQSLSTNGGEP